MHEILKHLPADAFVLDLGCATGSFGPENTLATAIRLDQDIPAGGVSTAFVRGDASRLPFADGRFAALVSNHSLEHFDELEAALLEMGRVVDRDGALFIAVPDASTLTDKVYRWLARGGGHVNPFTSAPELVSRIEKATGLPHIGTRVLYSSMSFLNSKNAPHPRPRRLLLLGGGTEWSLCLYTWLSRRLDRLLNTRTSVYGWALYFGNLRGSIDTEVWPNVCVRCGSGVPGSCLTGKSLVRRIFPGIEVYSCPYCGATNPFWGS